MSTESGINPVSETFPISENLPFAKKDEDKSLNLSIFGDRIKLNSKDRKFSVPFSKKEASEKKESPFFIEDSHYKNSKIESNNLKPFDNVITKQDNIVGTKSGYDLPVLEKNIQNTSESEPFSLAKRRDERVKIERPSGLLEPSDFSESSSSLHGGSKSDISASNLGISKNITERPSGLLEPSDFSEPYSKISPNIDNVNPMPVQIPSLLNIRENDMSEASFANSISPLIISGTNQSEGLMVDSLSVEGDDKDYFSSNTENKPVFDPFSSLVDLAESKSFEPDIKPVNPPNISFVDGVSENKNISSEIKEPKISSSSFEEVNFKADENSISGNKKIEEPLFPEIGQRKFDNLSINLPELPVSESRKVSTPIFSFDLSENKNKSNENKNSLSASPFSFDKPNQNQTKKEDVSFAKTKQPVNENPVQDNKPKKFSKMRFSGADVVQKPVLSSAGFTNAVDSDTTSESDMEKFLEIIEQNRDENQGLQRVNPENSKKDDKNAKSKFFGPASSIDLSFSDYKMKNKKDKLDEKNKKFDSKSKDKKEELPVEEPKKVKKPVISVSLPPLKDLSSNKKDDKDEEKNKDKRKSKSSSFAFEDLFVEQPAEPKKEERKSSYYDNDYISQSSSKKSNDSEDEGTTEKSVLSMFLENKEKSLDDDISEDENYLDWNIKFVKMPGMGMKDTFDMDKDEIIIGRGSSADLSLKDMALADRHVKLFMQSGELYLQKLDRKKQIYINGNPLISSASRVLKIGDRIQLSDMTVFEIQKK